MGVIRAITEMLEAAEPFAELGRKVGRRTIKSTLEYLLHNMDLVFSRVHALEGRVDRLCNLRTEERATASPSSVPGLAKHVSEVGLGLEAMEEKLGTLEHKVFDATCTAADQGDDITDNCKAIGKLERRVEELASAVHAGLGIVVDGEKPDASSGLGECQQCGGVSILGMGRCQDGVDRSICFTCEQGNKRRSSTAEEISEAINDPLSPENVERIKALATEAAKTEGLHPIYRIARAAEEAAEALSGHMSKIGTASDVAPKCSMCNATGMLSPHVVFEDGAAAIHQWLCEKCIPRTETRTTTDSARNP